MTNRIGIFGCGWLGFPLAIEFVKRGFEVHGTTTSDDKLRQLQMEGIKPYKVKILPTSFDGDIYPFLSNIDILVVNIPPRLRGVNTESFIKKMELLHKAVQKTALSKLLFISSTSVYGDVTGEVDEKTLPQPVTESGKQLLESELLFTKDPKLKTTIIRFGGLIGPTRHPVTMLSKRKNLSNGADPVNLIHLSDCIHMITTIIDNQYWNELFNGVYPLHPSKREYYTTEALKRNIPPPEYDDIKSNQSNKIVTSRNFTDKKHGFHTSIVS